MKKSKKIKKYICIAFFIIFITIALILNISRILEPEASTKLDGIESFPESYQPYLKEIAKNHPNWSFRALYTNLDWNYVINEETKFGVNLVPKNYSDRWKNTTPRSI